MNSNTWHKHSTRTKEDKQISTQEPLKAPAYFLIFKYIDKLQK